MIRKQSRISVGVVLVVVLLVDIDTVQGQQQQQQSPYAADGCDYLLDRCNSQFDSICDDANRNGTIDVDANDSCLNLDCYDCDPCHQFNFRSCDECINNDVVPTDCYYCPGNALCSSVKLDQEFYDLRFGTKNNYIACPTTNDWIDTVCDSSSSSSVNPVFNDPLYAAQQWTFQLMNIEDVWKLGYTGEGIHIRINDKGVDIYHPDLVSSSNKFDLEHSCTDYLPNTIRETHGTFAAVVATGGANNNACAVGVAPDSTFSSCNVFVDANPDGMGAALESSIDALGTDDVIQNVDIASNSWGFPTCTNQYGYGSVRQLQTTTCPFQSSVEIYTSPCEICTSTDFSVSSSEMSVNCQSAIVQYCSHPPNYEKDTTACIDYLDLYVDCEYNDVQQSALNALARGVTEGRNGNGIIYLVAVGNEYSVGADSNFEGWINTRFTIAVGAVGKFGLHSSYSTSGASVFIAGPGGDVDFVTNHVGCESIGMGTSFACPAVAGAIALLLQAHPTLSWRDVQGLLALTAIQTDPNHESWTINAANYHHSNLYGFGIVDALAAIEVANRWIPFGPEQSLLADSGILDLPISDNGGSTTTLSKLTVPNTENVDFVIETVNIYLDIHHASRGDLNIVLTSPSGTASTIHPGKRPENQILSKRWKLMTVKTWGEVPYGDWTLSITDEKIGNKYDGCIDLSWVSEVSNGNLTCALAELNNFCSNGQLLEQVLLQFPSPEGLTANQACCICGGGQASSDINPRLESWRIVIYGRHSDGTMPVVTGTSSNNNNNVPARPSAAPNGEPTTTTTTTTTTASPAADDTATGSTTGQQNDTGTGTTDSNEIESGAPVGSFGCVRCLGVVTFLLAIMVLGEPF